MKHWFSTQSADYAAYRPTYTDELLSFIADKAPAQDAVWDCATGNGQAAVGLARYFRQVYATDIAAEQIARALPHPAVAYRVAEATTSGLATSSVDCVTVAQGLHWFAVDDFYREVRRVARPGAVFAAWCYPLCHLDDPQWDAALSGFFQRIHAYFPAGREFVDSRYRSLDFPFEELCCPIFYKEYQWLASDIIGYIKSWSAVARYQKQHAEHPLQTTMGDELRLLCQRSAMHDDAGPMKVTFEFVLRLGRV